jgi:plastocyanin
MEYDKTDKRAFIALMGLAVLTAVMAYFLFSASSPQVGIQNSIYRLELPPESEAGAATTTPADTEAIDESQFANKVSISILAGASTEGNPDYGPDVSDATSDALVTFVNEDNAPHSATSGTGPADPESGKLFDSGLLLANDKFSIPAEKIGAGEHSFYCTVHPYMVGTITVA